MRTKLFGTALALALVAAVPVAAQYGHDARGDNGMRLFAGVYEPKGDSSYWHDSFIDFTGQAADFEDGTVGIEYSRELAGNLRLLAGGSFFEGRTDQAYRDFVDNRGDDITHRTTVTLGTATLGLAVNLAPRRAPVVPYIGAGVGLYSWELEERGDFIDFGPGSSLEIFRSTYRDDGVTPGWFWLAGLEIPLSSDFAIFAQGRWHHAEDDLEGDFTDLGKIDLSGRELAAGLTWRF